MSNVKVRLDDVKQIDIVNVPGGITAKELKKLHPDAEVISSLTMFVLKNGLNFVRVDDENKKDGYLGGNDGIGINNEKELVFCTYNDAYLSNDIRDYVSGFPTLVKDGKVNIDWGNKYSSYVDGYHKRLLIGFNGHLLIIVATNRKISLTAAAKLMVRYGCDYAINGDGGDWSPHLQRGNTILRKGYRKNPTWLLVYMDKKRLFIDHMLEHIGKDYIFGTNGEIATPSKLKQLISWFGLSHYKNSSFDATDSANNNIQDFDCSGLMIFELRRLGVIGMTADYTARGLFYNKCNEIERSELQNGDLVFYNNLKHVGMYYDGKVIEARGTAYGVIITDRLDDFTKFGRIKDL